MKVAGGSPAHSSGVAADDVILEADKQALSKWEDLQHLLQSKKVGEDLEVLIGRERELRRVTLKLQGAA
jgi:S1-C subfamily serine protease